MNVYHKGYPVLGPRGPAGPDGDPIGSIISYMGMTAPAAYFLDFGLDLQIIFQLLFMRIRFKLRLGIQT